MNLDAATGVGSFIGMIWAMFTSWTIPGTKVTPAGFLLVLLFITIGSFILKKVFGSW